MLGKNQSFAREVNNLLVLEALSKKPLSATELSSDFKLSNATLSSLLKNLISLGLIEQVGLSSVNKSGRKRVKYSLSNSYGNVLVISFTSLKYHAKLFSLKGDILLDVEQEVEKYDVFSIEQAINCVKEKIGNDSNIKYVVLCMPGLVNKDTGELQNSAQFDSSLFSSKNKLQDMFKKAFSCPVQLENDTKIMMNGELSKGTFKDSSNGLLAYVDYGVGGAFEFDNKLFLGSRGYSGEIGRLPIFKDNKISNLDDCSSIRHIKDVLYSIYKKKFHTKEIVSSFLKGEEEISSIVLESASYLGEALNRLISILDLEKIVISGRVCEFGQRYLDKVKESFVNQDIKIEFGSSYENSLFEGAKQIGVSYILNDAIKAN